MVAKKSSAKKTVKTAASKRPAAKKTSTKKTVAKKTPAKKTPAKKTTPKKAAPAKTTPRKAAKKAPAKKPSAPKTPVTKPPTTPVPPTIDPNPTGNTPATGFVFANPKLTADDYGNFSKADVFADSGATPSLQLQPVPAPWKTPSELSLSQVLGAATVAQITAAKNITFHCVGDTGGIHDPAKQFAVADAMANDLGSKTYANGIPAFFFHLGDVVYYLGQELYYYEQYYDPYRDYDAPIFAIPGNHDGMISPSIKQTTLQGFVENFCTQAPSKNPEAQGLARTTMIQPGVYFTLHAPFVDIIGLYSNIAEGGTEGVISGPIAGPAQLAFLQQQLAAIAAARKSGTRNALLLAVHHPPFTGSQDHAPSPTMLKQIDAACTAAGIYPDMVLSGHAHLYERYTRTINNSQIPFIVAGMGGYWNLSGMKKGTNNQPPATPFVGTDASGNKLVLEKFNNTTFGYLTLNISASAITLTFYGVTPGVGGQAASVTVADQFTLDLNKHTIT